MKRPIKNNYKSDIIICADDYAGWLDEYSNEQEKYIDHLESVLKSQATSIEDFDPFWVEFLNTNKKL